jgi:hypothetical protein
MKVTVTKVKDTINASIIRQAGDMKGVPAKAHQYFKSITPIDTGNARSKTSLVGNTILANYPYAVPLDKGHSKQAPKGMVEPTKRFIERLIKQKLRK